MKCLPTSRVASSLVLADDFISCVAWSSAFNEEIAVEIDTSARDLC